MGLLDTSVVQGYSVYRGTVCTGVLCTGVQCVQEYSVCRGTVCTVYSVYVGTVCTGVQCVDLNYAVYCCCAKQNADSVTVLPTAANKLLTLPTVPTNAVFLTQFATAVLKIATTPHALKALLSASIF